MKLKYIRDIASVDANNLEIFGMKKCCVYSHINELMCHCFFVRDIYLYSVCVLFGTKFH